MPTYITGSLITRRNHFYVASRGDTPLQHEGICFWINCCST